MHPSISHTGLRSLATKSLAASAASLTLLSAAMAQPSDPRLGRPGPWEHPPANDPQNSELWKLEQAINALKMELLKTADPQKQRRLDSLTLMRNALIQQQQQQPPPRVK
jgi:hypothetical protein